MASRWKQNILTLSNVLQKLSVVDISGNKLLNDEALQKWKEITLNIHDNDRTIFFVGNGASSSMASHFATDIAKNGHIRTQVFTDISLLTALANDISYKDVFAEPLRWWMKKGDMLIAISSSGNSPNIIQAVKEAKNLNGIVVTLSAMNDSNSIRKLGDLNFYVSAQTYGLAETAHAAILHYWVDMIGKASSAL